MSITPPLREKSGKRQRRTVDQQNEYAQRMAEAEIAVVLAQPHRRGNRSALAESALGRFVMDHKIDADCFRATDEYKRLRNMFRATIGAQKLEIVGGQCEGEGPTIETLGKWKRELDRIEGETIEVVGEGGFILLSRLIDSDVTIAPNSVACVKAALIALARAMGRRV